MNETIRKMTQHASVRAFEDQPLPTETKTALLAAARSGSSSNFVQAFSIIEITDSLLRQKIAHLTNSAQYVEHSGAFYLFIADLYRQSQILTKAGQSLAALQTMESLTVAIVDATIAAQNMAVAAESLDLGICYIGGIRNDCAQVADLLQLPKFTVPLMGLTIGIPTQRNEVKPRLLKQNQVATNIYPAATFSDLTAYEEQTTAYYASRTTNQQDSSWSEKNRVFFTDIRRPAYTEFLKQQGFLMN